MARHRDAVAGVKRIRRKINTRLMAAHAKGRLDEAIRNLERQGDQGIREALARQKAAKRRKHV